MCQVFLVQVITSFEDYEIYEAQLDSLSIER